LLLGHQQLCISPVSFRLASRPGDSAGELGCQPSTGCVYVDTSPGGEIQSYFDASPDDTLAAEVALQQAIDADNDKWYGLDQTCIGYTNDKYNEFAEEYQNSSSDLPDRPPPPRHPLRRLQDALMGWMF